MVSQVSAILAYFFWHLAEPDVRESHTVGSKLLKPYSHQTILNGEFFIQLEKLLIAGRLAMVESSVIFPFAPS